MHPFIDIVNFLGENIHEDENDYCCCAHCPDIVTYRKLHHTGIVTGIDIDHIPGRRKDLVGIFSWYLQATVSLVSGCWDIAEIQISIERSSSGLLTIFSADICRQHNETRPAQTHSRSRHSAQVKSPKLGSLIIDQDSFAKQDSKSFKWQRHHIVEGFKTRLKNHLNVENTICNYPNDARTKTQRTKIRWDSVSPALSCLIFNNAPSRAYKWGSTIQLAVSPSILKKYKIKVEMLILLF